VSDEERCRAHPKRVDEAFVATTQQTGNKHIAVGIMFPAAVRGAQEEEVTVAIA
jgi:hypothetical protein